jgi:UDP-N-acetyl-2-amino-2-deoxyglucuronate dehydrogenase
MAKDVRLVFVGCGGCLTISFGPILPFVEGFRVVAGVDASDEALARAHRDFGIEAGYHDLEECLEKEKPDAALIAAPVYHHRDLAVLCARRGVHVLIEKPMARSVTECDEIIDAHERAGTVLMVALMKRYNRSLVQAAELIGRGEIGQVMGVRHCWEWGGHESAVFAPLWRGELRTWGGQWQDHGSHSVDLATWWAGPVRSVMGVFDITEPYWNVENEYNVICTTRGARGASTCRRTCCTRKTARNT